VSGAVLISAACTGCGSCILTCPERALRRAPGRPILVAARCTGCLACIEVCPVDAIEEDK
jgi:Pyruvate/2-oxoacid:ferredoxin oxidoreductase delta subunit